MAAIWDERLVDVVLPLVVAIARLGLEHTRPVSVWWSHDDGNEDDDDDNDGDDDENRELILDMYVY